MNGFARDGDSDRQGTSSGRRAGTSSGRPTTGRPRTARTGTASGQRPLTRGVGGLNNAAGDQDGYLDEWDEDEYESEDDGDVFAFVPPDIGQSAPTIQIGDASGASVNASAMPEMPPTPNDASRQASDPNALSIAATDLDLTRKAQASQEEDEEETFYFDEVTGAVYDAQGNLVEMPPGFDPAALRENVQETAQGNATESSRSADAHMGDDSVAIGMVEHEAEAIGEPVGLEEVRSAIPLPGRGNSFDSPIYDSGTRRAAYLADPRVSMDRASSNASSVSRDVGPALSHARSVHALPQMDVLDEVDYLPTSREGLSSRHGARDYGTTASGGTMVDSHIPVSQSRRTSGLGTIDPAAANASAVGHGSMRQRNNRLSVHADAGRSPDSDVKFNLGTSYDFGDTDADLSSKLGYEERLGGGEGLAHTSNGNAQMGPMGMRMVELEMDMEEDSPYPEVRASVSNIDDPDMPAFTFRMFLIAMILVTIASAANILFNLRYPSPAITPIIIQLVAYPIGKCMAYVLPITEWRLPRWLGGGTFSLNPGAFNIKEHALITLTANVAISQAYGFNTLLVLDSDKFYGEPTSKGFGILYMLTSQLLGFSFSGLCIPFLVTPASMIWPQNLVTATVLNTLHAEDDGMDGSITRFRWFSFLSLGAFVWYFVTNFLFTALNYFNWVCWIVPNNHLINTLFGTVGGMGLSVLTFDWSQISYIGSPLVAPWWAECNIFAGFLAFYWIVAPILYYKNVWNFAHLPFISGRSFDRFAQPYDVKRVLGADSRLNLEQYAQYSALYLPVSLFMAYWSGFATNTSVLVHTALYHGDALWKGARQIKTEEDDIHAKFMRRYPTVPMWWYLASLVVTFGLAIVVVEVFSTGMPVWALVLAIAVSVVYTLPSGFIYAMTGTLPLTNLIGEVVAGYVMPGRAIPNMIFKVYAVQTMASTLNFVQDLKVGHYMKINPRYTFTMQFIAVAWTAIVQWAVKQFMFSQVDRICSDDQPQRFDCPNADVFFNSSVIWGAIGPTHLFGKESLYGSVYWGLLVGAIVPIPIWFLARRFPRSIIKFISTPIFFNGIAFIPPCTGINYTSWFLTGFIFQYVIRKFNFRWWSKYNFVTSAAMDFGTVTSFILQFFVLSLPRNGEVALNWWGNSVAFNNLDGAGTPFMPTGPDGIRPPPAASM
ncbi:Sexual differentiation process protein ISP4 [Ceraceosorus bombacis]|uniref:Sexual differentiation process protein ISP4 n=1 Tax=Ceraceosorus bombacis TaxID=401625 RepID=A0A0P1BGZ2_9BASI|nr:Sexual differentiation process protein ISP4 [Ceraceosorus bombacis]